MLLIKNLNATVNGKKILKDVNLTVKPGEIHVIMGPNGAGKTTLAMALMGYHQFKTQSSRPKDDQPLAENIKYQINGKDIGKLKTEDRAREGLFVGFQNPPEIEGVSFFSFLRTSYKSIYPDKKKSISEFKKDAENVFNKAGLDSGFLGRSINKGFSGGEKKRAEIAQLLILKPRFAILDEIDSGLDIDGLRTMAKIIKILVQKQKMGMVFITHNPRVFRYLLPDFVHILKDGEIKVTGGISIVKKIEKGGYDAI